MTSCIPQPPKDPDKRNILDLSEDEQIALYTRAAEQSALAQSKVVDEYEARVNGTGKAPTPEEQVERDSEKTRPTEEPKLEHDLDIAHQGWICTCGKWFRQKSTGVEHLREAILTKDGSGRPEDPLPTPLKVDFTTELDKIQRDIWARIHDELAADGVKLDIGTVYKAGQSIQFVLHPAIQGLVLGVIGGDDDKMLNYQRAYYRNKLRAELRQKVRGE